MGTGYKGGAREHLPLSRNEPKLKKDFGFHDGYFGKRGVSSSSHVRNYVSENPEITAKKFYDTAAFGGEEEIKYGGKIFIARMYDGTFISYRPVSTSDGSPAVDINIKTSTDKNIDVKNQKIHFVKGDEHENGSQVR